MVKEVVRVTDLLEQAWFSLKYNHEQLRYACQMMNDMNGGGYELVEPDHAETGEGSGSKLPVWTKEKEAQYQAFQTWMPVLISYGRDVETGKKKVAWDPTVGDEGDVVILGVPGDVYIGVTQNGQLQVVTLAEPGNVGGWLVVAGLVVATVAVIVGAVAVLNSANNLVKANMAEREQKFAADMTEKYGFEKGMEIVREVNEGAKARADAEVEREKVSPFAKISETAESAASALIAIGIGAAAIYALTVAVDWSKTRKAKA